MKKYENITAFILAGGLSSRMGTNKALLQIGGKSLVQIFIDLLDSLFIEVVISSNEPQLFQFTNKKIIKDIFPGRGPLGGIHSTLKSTDNEKIFLISCDMPFINKELINYLCNYESQTDIILPKVDGRIQPLCGIYSKKILPEVELLLKKSAQRGSTLKGSIYELMNRVETEIVDVVTTSFYHPDLFFNINTPADYLHAKKILEQK
jgi:molybdopterin-guanine dinucleotide biosynthesis protein A